MAEPEVSDPFRTHLKVAVSGLLTELGFNSADAAALETLTELTQSFIGELGRSARSFCELACRVEPVSADILLSLVEMGVPGMRKKKIRDNIMGKEKVYKKSNPQEEARGRWCISGSSPHNRLRSSGT